MYSCCVRSYPYDFDFPYKLDNSSQAFEFVKGATAPMMLGNSVAVGVSIILVSLFSHERFLERKPPKASLILFSEDFSAAL